jgi:bifunctional DNA-binding transcriptional regulator/antitoxin component of YhaV-PrlF toxin-antitoxin module
MSLVTVKNKYQVVIPASLRGTSNKQTSKVKETAHSR